MNLEEFKRNETDSMEFIKIEGEVFKKSSELKKIKKC